MKAEFLYHSGDDLSVVNAAKVSFDKMSTWEKELVTKSSDGMYMLAEWETFYKDKGLSKKDIGLVNYLAKHNHWTPFAHNSITLRMKAPVPIRTQCFKHKAGFVENEESRRYISSTPTIFVPLELRKAPEGSIKQGSAGVHPESEEWLKNYVKVCEDALYMYEAAVEDGVCPEQARFMLPQACEVQWIWTGNLAAYARFFNQRTDDHAQKEVQDLATEVGKLIEPLFPISWKALTQW